MTGLTYDTDTTPAGDPRVCLYIDGHYVGSLRGTVHQSKTDTFEQRQGIITVHYNDTRIATLWECTKKDLDEEGQNT